MESQDTLRDAIIWFADFEHCRQFMMELRWPDSVVKCPQCGSETVTWLAKQRVWKCYTGHQRPTFSLKTSTIFEDSPIALEKWLCAAWLLISCKNGISSYEIHRGLKMTQKTAWFMHKAKRAETITGRGPQGKEIVFGMVERGGKVIAGHVDTRKRKDLQPLIRERIEAGAAIFSDELKSYDGLEDDYQHAVINHAVEYVNGNVHTNTMENFSSLLKRGLRDRKSVVSAK